MERSGTSWDGAGITEEGDSAEQRQLVWQEILQLVSLLARQSSCRLSWANQGAPRTQGEEDAGIRKARSVPGVTLGDKS